MRTSDFLVISRLTGGLGNQLFQFAAGLAVSRRIGADLLVDVQYYDAQPQWAGDRRAYCLNRLCDPPGIVRRRNLMKLLAPSLVGRKLFGQRPIRVFDESETVALDLDVLSAMEPCYLRGYWQSLQYFENIQHEVRDRIRFCEKPVNSTHLHEQFINANVASVHIRRGDYAKNPALFEKHGVLPMTYYETALNYLIQNFGVERALVFTDDPEWVKSHFPRLLPTTIASASTNDEFADLSLMRRCKYHVIANSSFSWWGAWLSDAENGAIVAPKRWFTSKDINKSAIVPPNWIVF